MKREYKVVYRLSNTDIADALSMPDHPKSLLFFLNFESSSISSERMNLKFEFSTQFDHE